MLEAGRVSTHLATVNDLRIERTSRIEFDDKVSKLYFDYLIHSPTETRSVQEVHELGMFTPEELQTAFALAGLNADYDTEGLTGRGLWTARNAA